MITFQNKTKLDKMFMYRKKILSANEDLLINFNLKINDNNSS